MTKLRYLKGYPEHILAQIEPMIDNGKLAEWVKNKLNPAWKGIYDSHDTRLDAGRKHAPVALGCVGMCVFSAVKAFR